MTADNFSVVFPGPVSEETDGLKIMTLGYRNGNVAILKDVFNAVDQTIRVKWRRNAGGSSMRGYFSLLPLMVHSSEIATLPDNTWLYTTFNVFSTTSKFEVITCVENYGDMGGDYPVIVEGDLALEQLANATHSSLKLYFDDARAADNSAYIQIGEVIVPDNSPAQFYETSLWDFETVIPSDIIFDGGIWTRDNTARIDGTYALKGECSGIDTDMDNMSFNVSGSDLLTFDIKVVLPDDVGDFDATHRLEVLLNGVRQTDAGVYELGNSWTNEEQWCEISLPLNSEIENQIMLRFYDPNSTYYGDEYYQNEIVYVDNIRQYILNSSPINLSLDNNSIDENSSAPTFVGALSADDADNDALIFSIPDDNSMFSIDGNMLVADMAYDYEIESQTQAEVMVSDGISDPVLETFTISINDVNEAPVIAAGQPLSVFEESPVSTVVGSVTATDEDSGDNAPVFSIQSGNEDGFFALNAATGELTIVQAELNRYDYESFSLLVRATDQNDAQLFSEETVVVNVDEIPFSGGAGTEADPFQIKTPKDLDEIRNYLGSSHADKYFELINDIDLQEYLSEGNPGYNEGAFWDPIGYDSGNAFYGYFDGENNSISGLVINRPGENYVGLFGTVTGKIENAVLELGVSQKVSGNNFVGGLVARTTYSSKGIINSSVAGSVEGIMSVGGIVGDNGNLIVASSFVGSVEGENNVGGLAGYNTGDISESFFSGVANGQSNVGGIAGIHYSDYMGIGGVVSACRVGSESQIIAALNYAGGITGYNQSDILNSYSNAEISCPDYVGGIAGYNDREENMYEDVIGVVMYCYSASSIMGSSNAGPLVGAGNGDITFSYWDINASGQESSAGGTGLNGIAMREAASFTDWDFTNVWGIDALEEYVSYPYLLNNEENPHPGAIGKVTVTSWPTASDIVYGQVVGESVLSGGAATHEGSPVSGNFYFMFVADMNEAGTVEEEVAFFPVDAEAYLPVIDGSTSLNVLPKPVSVINAVAQDKIYDGTTVAVVSEAVLEDNAVEGGDDVVLSNHTSGTFAQTGAGDGITVTTNMTLSGPDAANYDLEQPVLSASISKASLTVTAGDQTRLYGEVNPDLTFGYSGFVNGEDASVLMTLPSVSTLADAGSNVGDYAITVGDGSDENYDFSYIEGVLSVNPAPLTVKAKDATRIVGATNPEFEFEYTGFVNGEDQSVIDFLPGASCEADEFSEPGDYPIIVSPGDDGNYFFIVDNSGVLTVTTATSVLPELNGETNVFPVPADTYLFVSGINIVSVVDMEVVDMSGRTIKTTYSESDTGSLRIDISSLKSGIYFLKIRMKERTILEKIVVL